MEMKPLEEHFDFRKLHPRVFLGAASDRYAGWIGQIYPEAFRSRITRRSKQVGGKRFVEEVLPLESVRYYFEHFRTVELDFTFYETLLDADKKPTRTFRTLAGYVQQLGVEDRLVVKVPQVVFARKLKGPGGFVKNSAYLDPELFVTRFLEPARALADPWLDGFVFEQEYQRKEERVESEVQARELDRFFTSVPADSRYHLEIRTEALWRAPLLGVLEYHGVGLVLSHWTWLPTLGRQFDLVGRRCRNKGHATVIRLMTPRGMRYEQAYARAFPFDRIVEGMLDARMIEETAGIMWAVIRQGATVRVIVNNRAGGNAPLIARQLALRFKTLGPDGVETRT